MKKQFLHEQSNRRDRAKKKDYLPDLQEGTNQKSDPGSITLFSQSLQAKQRLIDRYRRGGVVINSRPFFHRWTRQDFITNYGEKQGSEFERLTQLAKENLAFVIEQIREGRVIEDISSGKLYLSPSVKTACFPYYEP